MVIDLCELSNVQKNVSLPVSLSGSPLMQSRSPHRSGMMSPSPISTPLVNSGSSTPLTGGHGAIPFQVNGTLKQNTHTDESFENFPRSPNGPYINGSCLNSPYHGCGQDAYLGINAVQTPEGSPTPQDQIAKNSDILGMMRESNGELQRQYGGQVALAEHVSQQLLKIPSKLPGIGFRPGSPMIAHANSHGYH